MKLDYVVTRQLNLESLRNSIRDWLVIDEVFKIYTIEDGVFKLLKFEDQLSKLCEGAKECREVVFYVDEKMLDIGGRSNVETEDTDVEEQSTNGEGHGQQSKNMEGQGQSKKGIGQGQSKKRIGQGQSKNVRKKQSKNGKGQSKNVESQNVELGSVFVQIEPSIEEEIDTDNGDNDSDDLCDSDYDMVEDSEEDDDDLLFDSNVNDNVEEISEDSEAEPDVVNVEGQCFDEWKDSDGEEQEPQYPIFNPEVIFEPDFELGMLFGSREEFRKAVQSHAIRIKRSLKFPKIAPTRCYASCRDVKCGWTIHLIKKKDEETWQINKYVDKHTCDPTFHVTNLKSGWLSEKYLKKFMTDRKRKAKVFQQDVMDELGCEVTRDQASRAKRLALKKIEGDPDVQYSKLWEYAGELRRANPGSTILIGCEQDENDEQRFKKFYVCLDAVKKGFASGCRPIIGVDGCHLKGLQKGVLLTAVGVDANNNIFPIAWAVVDREAFDT